ncbi:MAG: hypothetical protein CME70_14005 [Halobacteriovorax sp.]|nr:hypothetical protein [Halobacteriovorax sp.]|tara:strand:- start:1734 stop:1928 length:195 start_codon:yes stop_codon:yes gene_type:complete
MSSSELGQIIEDQVVELAARSNIRVSRLRKIVSEEIRMAYGDASGVERLIPEIDDSQDYQNSIQ